MSAVRAPSMDEEQIPGIQPIDWQSIEMDRGAWDLSVPEAFRRVARRFGDRPAVIDERSTTTYGQLDVASDALASVLVEPAPDDRPILILTRHDVSAVVAILGVAKSGHCYAVVDSQAPLAYRQDVIRRFGPNTIVVDAASAAGLPCGGGLRVIVLGESSPSGVARPGIDPKRALSASFTSGSSGTPKAVMHSHHAVVRNALRVSASFKATEHDRFLGAGPLQFTGSATSLYGALLTGAAFCPFPFATHGAGPFAAFARAAGISIAQLTPALASALGQHAGKDGSVSTVRLVNLGGDRLTADQVRRLAPVFPSAKFLYRYNTSETNWIAGLQIDPGVCTHPGALPAGWPVPWVDIAIRDSSGSALPPGETGELCVHGDSLSLGYLGDPERTRARFVDRGKGLEYRTGDRARARADGLLELAGREDSIVKVRGVLVDLDAIERALEALPGVKSAAAITWVASSGDTRLAAFVLGAQLSPTVLRAQIGSGLPQAMVPASIAVLEEFPITARGKRDTEALRVLAAAAATNGRSPPRNDAERSIAGKFAEILDCHDVSRDDDFFQLGADSLHVAELMEAIATDHGIAMQLTDLLENPTPALLALWMGTGVRQSRHVVRLSPAVAGTTPLVFFGGMGGTSFRDLAFLSRSIRDRTSYAIVPRAFEYRGRPDRSPSARAANAVNDLLGQDRNGRFVLVGRSGGGIVALEAGRQMVERGTVPPLVVLLDTYGPKGPRFRRLRVDFRAIRARRRAKDARRRARGARRRTRVFRRAFQYLRAVVREIRFQYIGWTAGIIPRRAAEQRESFHSMAIQASRRERGIRYGGPVVLLRAEDRNADSLHDNSADLGWGGYLTGAFTVIGVPGNHEDMPYRDTTAAALAGVLARHAL